MLQEEIHRDPNKCISLKKKPIPSEKLNQNKTDRQMSTQA